MGAIGAFSATRLDRLPARSFRSSVPLPSNSIRPPDHHNPHPDRPALTRRSCGSDTECGRLGSPEPPAGPPLRPERDPALGYRASRGSLPGIQSDASAAPPTLPQWRPDAIRGSSGHHPPGNSGGPASGRPRESLWGSAAGCFSFRSSNPSSLALLQLRIVVALTVQSSDT